LDVVVDTAFQFNISANVVSGLTQSLVGVSMGLRDTLFQTLTGLRPTGLTPIATAAAQPGLNGEPPDEMMTSDWYAGDESEAESVGV